MQRLSRHYGGNSGLSMELQVSEADTTLLIFGEINERPAILSNKQIWDLPERSEMLAVIGLEEIEREDGSLVMRKLTGDEK